MASEIDICNLALARLGDDATVASIDPPEGSPQAAQCARFYPMALDTLLDSYNWGFATTRATLSQLAAAPLSGWDYAFSAPSNVVNSIAVYAADALDDFDPQPFEAESLPDGTSVLYCNISNPVLKYLRRETDTMKFQPLFTDALSMLLASHLAGPLLKGEAGIAASKFWYQAYLSRLSDAKASDAAQRRVRPTHSVPWMADR
jgi:hypothetical protein